MPGPQQLLIPAIKTDTSTVPQNDTGSHFYLYPCLHMSNFVCSLKHGRSAQHPSLKATVFRSHLETSAKVGSRPCSRGAALMGALPLRGRGSTRFEPRFQNKCCRLLGVLVIRIIVRWLLCWAPLLMEAPTCARVLIMVW